jgi:orotidine-5'-phosphate decarboxylase
MALVPGPRVREGGLISSSRATLFPPEAAEGTYDAWKAAFEDTLSRHVAAVADSLKR